MIQGMTATVLEWDIYMGISTHTPHARRDPLTLVYSHTICISTHTPHARRDRNMLHCIAVTHLYMEADKNIYDLFSINHQKILQNLGEPLRCFVFTCISPA